VNEESPTTRTKAGGWAIVPIPTNCTFFNLKIYLLIPFHDDKPWCLNGQGDCDADNTATPMRAGMGYAAHPQILYVHFFENTFVYYLFLQATSRCSTPLPSIHIHRPATPLARETTTPGGPEGQQQGHVTRNASTRRRHHGVQGNGGTGERTRYCCLISSFFHIFY